MGMPHFRLDERASMTPLQLEAERFAFAVWKRFEEISKAGWEHRILGSDFRAFTDAAYDEYLKARADWK